MNKVCFLLLWSVILPCFGQVPVDEIPPGNPTQFPGGDAAWVVELTPSGGGKDSAIKKVQVTKSGAVARYVITWSSGKITERWRFSSAHMTVDQNPTSGSAIVILDSNLLFNLSMPSIDGVEATAFDWINRPFYKDTVPYEGSKTPCYHYAGMVSNMHLNPRPPPELIPYPPTMHEAWIDKKTLLPVAIDDGYNLAIFTFLPPPTEPLVPPQVISSEATRYTGLLAPVKRPPPAQ